jgi:hypothetical protein
MPSKILCLLWLAATLNVTGAVAQDDVVPIGVTVTPTTGLVTTEAGGTATFTVVLNSQPTADVTIALASSDISEGTVGPAALTFTTRNWNTPKTVTVTGVDDLLVDGDLAYTILTAAANSADRGYNNLDPANVAVTNTDNDSAGTTTPAPPPPPVPAPGGIRIAIKNAYFVTLDFGPLGKGWRKGVDEVVGVLKHDGNKYVGIVTAEISANQVLSSPFRNCPEAATKGNQQLKITGRPVSGFGPFQTIDYDRRTSTGRETGEFLELRVYPETAPQMSKENPCHELLEVAAGIFILPLNDSRWSLSEEGYIIVLPSSGLLSYSDDAVAKKIPPPKGPLPLPLDAQQSLWTIQVERLP